MEHDEYPNRREFQPGRERHRLRHDRDRPGCADRQLYRHRGRDRDFLARTVAAESRTEPGEGYRALGFALVTDPPSNSLALNHKDYVFVLQSSTSYCFRGRP